ncbi:MAG: CocE/NonD family hydrolase [Proteobacteria bacterium]|nr:CocE/NonD family hydrolase [Pseudomonadota bacterium]
MAKIRSKTEREGSQPIYQIKTEKDVPIPMPDGVRVFVDIYRPDAEGRFPALLAYSPYGKELQTLTKPLETDDWETVSRGWNAVEAGNAEYFVSRGYIHVIADTRGIALSDGEYSERKVAQDGYHIIEWIAEQPWCNGNVGMVGMSIFAILSLKVAALNPPHLKAICPVEALTDYYRHWSYHGGILQYGFFQYSTSVIHTAEQRQEFSKEELTQRVNELKESEDIRGYPLLYKILINPKINPRLFAALLHPYDEQYWRDSSCYPGLNKIRIPCYLMCRWNAWPLHLPGAFQAYEHINAQKKLRLYATPSHITGPGRPWSHNHEHVLRWYDHWLKGIDTGIMNEPPIQLFVQGINQWRDEFEWPLARTKWTKYYLRSNGMLEDIPPIQLELPDTFINKPWLRIDEEVPFIKYTTPPLSEGMEVTGPIALSFHASLSTEDASWMADIKDIDRAGAERLVSKGWLKASHRELDETKSRPYKPYHPHARSLPVEPGEIYQYVMEICETSNVFRAGHRIQLVIKGQDSRREEGDHYFHLNNMKETKHTVYHSDEYPSYLLLPIIPVGTS